jgi:hypothetical protein
VGEAVGVDVGPEVEVGGWVAVALLCAENVAVGTVVFGLGKVQANKPIITDTENRMRSVRLLIQPPLDRVIAFVLICVSKCIV